MRKCGKLKGSYPLRGRNTSKYNCKQKIDLERRGLMVAQGDGLHVDTNLELPQVSSILEIMIICGLFLLTLVGVGNCECINLLI